MPPIDDSDGVPFEIPTEPIEYETRTEKVIRGREANRIAELQAEGWELVSQSEGMSLRRLLVFRRQKRRASVIQKRLTVAGIAAALVLCVGAITWGALTEDDETADDSSADTASQTEGESNSEPGVGSSSEATDAGSTEPSMAETSAEPEPDSGRITTANNPEFARLLKGGDCDDTLAAFANKYAGREIEFNGSIIDMAPHGDNDTRYDILIGPGNKGQNTTTGPAFKYEDVNTVYDLNLIGDVPEYVGPNDKFRFVAEVGEYDGDMCLFFLAPIETEAR